MSFSFPAPCCVHYAKGNFLSTYIICDLFKDTVSCSVHSTSMVGLSVNNGSEGTWKGPFVAQPQVPLRNFLAGGDESNENPKVKIAIL
jgi:hypothetical protein